MTPTETTKLCTLSDKVLRDEDRRTDVVELAKLGRLAGKLIPEIMAERDAYRAQRDAIESAKDVVSRFAASLAGSVNGDEYAWTLEDMKRDATRWREATAEGAESDEALARAFYDAFWPRSAVRWDVYVGREQMATAVRVVRERVRAQCAARAAADVAEAFGEPSDKPYQDTLEIVRQRLAEAMAKADATGYPAAPREPRPGEVWRSIPWGVNCECIGRNQMNEWWEMKPLLGSLSCPEMLCLHDDNIGGWTFVRGPYAAEPARHLNKPASRCQLASL